MPAPTDFLSVWRKLNEARTGTEWENQNKLEKKIPVSHSTWHSYQRWFEGGQGTSPTVSFLSRLAELLRLRLIMDVESSRTKGAHGGAKAAMKDDAVNTVVRLMMGLTGEQRLRVRDLVIDAVTEYAANPLDGDEPDGHRPSPK